jgi:hypothetical protein
MNTAIIEFNALPDAVGTAAKHHDTPFVAGSNLTLSGAL